ncbi:MAG: hypothetical protein ABTQ32_20890 [Myxococcaceae bacterium]
MSGQTTCRQFCGPQNNTCVSGTLCNSLIQLGVAPGGERHLLCLAPTACDPLTQAPCTSTQNCTLFASGSPPGCLPAGPAASGGTCSGSVLCQRGHLCVASVSSMGICRPFCSTTGSPGCTSGTCQAIQGAGGTVGTCQ